MAATKPKTQAEKLAERRAELDWLEQMNAAHAAERAEREAEQQAFLVQVQQRRDALARGEELPPVVIPTIDSIYQAKAAEEQAAAEEAERQRIASLDPTSVIFSALPVAKKEFINSWRKANPGMEFPLEALPYL